MRFFLLLFFVPTLAHADWQSIHCQKEGDTEFLHFVKEPNGQVHVESEKTLRYLLGLDCNVPNSEEPIFFCRGQGQSDITFSSSLVHERGFTKDNYDRLVDQEHFEMHLGFRYVNSKGESKHATKDWKFETAECRVVGGR